MIDPQVEVDVKMLKGYIYLLMIIIVLPVS